MYFSELLFSSTDLKISRTCLWQAAKNFDLKLFLENKIQGLVFTFSGRHTFCKMNHPSQSAAEWLWSGPYRLYLYPTWGEPSIYALFSLKHKVCTNLFKESAYKTLQKHIFIFICNRGNENLMVVGESPQRMTNNTDHKNCSHGLLLLFYYNVPYNVLLKGIHVCVK